MLLHRSWFWPLALCLPLLAQAPAGGGRAIALQSTQGAERRVALVIGNAAYKDQPLKNPVNDARAIAGKLGQLGFEVILREDLGHLQIGATMREFRSLLTPGAVALFYYAGHGLQVDGVNYLPAVDADIVSEDDVPTQSLEVGKVLEAMEVQKTRINLVFLDACRNNPFTRSFRSVGGGLAKITPPSGTILSYATRPGKIAADGTGPHGLYTEQLLQVMDEQGLVIEQAMKKVLAGVRAASGGRQEPWIEGGIDGNFFFRPSGPAPAMRTVATGDAMVVELAFWDSIKGSSDPDDFRAYLDKYPAGQFAALARNRLKGKAPVVAQAGGSASSIGPNPAKLAGVPPSPASRAALADEVDLGQGVRLKVIPVPAGAFNMGDRNDGFSDERPVHPVTLTRGLWMGKGHVSRREWWAVMGGAAENQEDPDTPMDGVSWVDCQEFLARLNRLGQGAFRLPTEAEWEYASRAGGEGETYHSEISIKWAATNTRKFINGFGLDGMDGDLWEWCQDWYGPYRADSQVDPQGPATGTKRVARGGTRAYFYSQTANRHSGHVSTVRSPFTPEKRMHGLGLRIVRSQD